MESYPNNHPNNLDEESSYQRAKAIVKKRRGFYIHLLVYIVVNIFLIVSMLSASDLTWSSPELYFTALFWGIGLLAHGLSVFMPHFILGKDWEERQIKKLIDKDKASKNNL